MCSRKSSPPFFATAVLEAPMAVNTQRVAVIGAGPAGAIATDALVKEDAFTHVRVFERKSTVGGTWVCDENDASPRIHSLRDLVDGRADRLVPIPCRLPCQTPRSEEINSPDLRFSGTGAYANLHSNLPPSTMSFTQEPLPEILSKQTLERYGPGAPFRERRVVRDWVAQVFERGGHDNLIELNTAVEKAEKVGDRWLLTLRKEEAGGKANKWWTEEFDAVVVATGHYNVPYVPSIPGLAEYEERYPGSIRHSKHFRSAEEFRGKKVIVVGGSVSAFDALHDIRKVSQRPIIASVREPLAAFGWTPFTHPHIDVRSPIKQFDRSTRRIEFADGSSAEDVDIVLFATGYDFSFPFLPDVKVKDRRVEGLYQHVFNIQDPTLAFVGMVTGGLTFRVFEWQAVAVSRFLSGRAHLPPRSEMEKWEQEHLAKRGPLGFFNISPDFEGYFETLRSIAGESAQGTRGRVLPKFEKWWPDEFTKVVQARLSWWEREMRAAQGGDMGAAVAAGTKVENRLNGQREQREIIREGKI